MEAIDALERLTPLLDAGSEQAVLEVVADAACHLTGAEDAVALLVGPDGSVADLVQHTTGDDRTTRRTTDLLAVLGLLDRSHPLDVVAVVLAGTGLRLEALGLQPLALAGAPAGGGGQAGPFLGVPITAGDRVLGCVCLTRAAGREGFTAAEQHLAELLGRHAAAAVTALRSAQASRDLLDGLDLVGQRAGDPVLRGDSSPAVRRLLRAARTITGADLTFLSHIQSGTQTFTTVDTDAGAAAGAGAGLLDLAEGTVIDAEEGYCTLLVQEAIPASVPDVAAHPVLGPMGVTTDLGVGAYCGVPVRLPDGSLYGTLCGLSWAAAAPLTAAQLQAMGTLAAVLGAQVAEEAQLAREHQLRRTAFSRLLDGTCRTLVLQPIVDLELGCAVGYEALSRFTDAVGGPRNPEEVFAEASTLDLTVDLELAAARDALSLLPALPDGVYLSVNFSPRTLAAPATHELLCGVHADRVVIELTEHEQVADYPALLQILGRLRARGLRLAIDDTGAGFASLQHLTELAPDVIKLDIAFVRDIHTDPARRAVARAILGLAAETGAALIAEGIETAAELDQLRRLGAPLGQGCYLGRPAPVHQALRALSPTT